MLFSKIFQIVKLSHLFPDFILPSASALSGLLFSLKLFKGPVTCSVSVSSPVIKAPLTHISHQVSLPNSAQRCQKYHLHWYIFPWWPDLILAHSNFWDVNPLQLFLNPSRHNAIHIQRECHSLLYHAGQMPPRSLSLGLISLLSSALYIDLLAWSSLLNA